MRNDVPITDDSFEKKARAAERKFLDSIHNINYSFNHEATTEAIVDAVLISLARYGDKHLSRKKAREIAESLLAASNEWHGERMVEDPIN